MDLTAAATGPQRVGTARKVAAARRLQLRVRELSASGQPDIVCELCNDIHSKLCTRAEDEACAEMSFRLGEALCLKGKHTPAIDYLTYAYTLHKLAKEELRDLADLDTVTVCMRLARAHVAIRNYGDAGTFFAEALSSNLTRNSQPQSIARHLVEYA